MLAFLDSARNTAWQVTRPTHVHELKQVLYAEFSNDGKVLEADAEVFSRSLSSLAWMSVLRELPMGSSLRAAGTVLCELFARGIGGGPVLLIALSGYLNACTEPEPEPEPELEREPQPSACPGLENTVLPWFQGLDPRYQSTYVDTMRNFIETNVTSPHVPTIVREVVLARMQLHDQLSVRSAVAFTTQTVFVPGKAYRSGVH